ncbi:MAG: NTP transferase domain-containing protein [Rhodobacteraceae bacterium]|nr:NTP transferase domain-containing protein [Paracoccaceae bacterium]
MTDIAVLVLAAGSSSRMQGRDKLLEEIGGVPLLSRMISRAQKTGMSVYVTLPDPTHPRATRIREAHPVWVPDAAEGMSASIRAGIAALPQHIQAAMILPADMPELTETDLYHIAQHYHHNSDTILQATSEDGVPGHPVLFPRRYFAEMTTLTGDIGAKPIIRANLDKRVLVALPGKHALTDLDTPEAWAAWRSGIN